MKYTRYMLILTLMVNIINITTAQNKPYVKGVAKPVISLNGKWEININPPNKFWDNNISPAKWNNIIVPGEAQMQGFAIKYDVPFVYKKQIDIPFDFKDKDIYVRFDGVYGYARVWINGNFITEHYGGFTQWLCNITPFVKPGVKAWLTVEVTDRKDDISFESGYAHHQIGGINRNVNLIALPKNRFEHLSIETNFDKDYINAELKVKLSAILSYDAELRLKLTDKSGKEVVLNNKKTTIPMNSSDINVINKIVKPFKWDAEHPNLYKLEIALYIDGKLEYKEVKNIGFREIIVDVNKLLVNGMPVKMRGVCRHSIHPLFGRAADNFYDEKDVRLAKEANLNFIRTSHYPPSEMFLDYCDKYGLYVEPESAVCFVNNYRGEYYNPSNSQSDEKFTARYLTQLKEMVELNRNHPSVIIWSIGNESAAGTNFLKSYQWIKENETTRPIIFSYPFDSIKCYDIISMHYPYYKGNIDQSGYNTKDFSSKMMPMIFDEWAHVPCYDTDDLINDPSVQDFYGISLDSMFMNAFNADGSLGGAIWGMIDETFMLPDTIKEYIEVNKPKIRNENGINEKACTGYGPWGFIDTWRRKKPEFWNVKKAYSPTKIYVRNIDDFIKGKPINIPVHNRFDHTNLTELKIIWKYGTLQGQVKSDIPPHAKGVLTIPANNWEDGKVLQITFIDNYKNIIDEYHLKLGKADNYNNDIRSANKSGLKINEKENEFIVEGNKLNITFNKQTGLITKADKNNKVVIKSGPYINYRIPFNSEWNGNGVALDYDYKNWKLANSEHKLINDTAIINLYGSYDSVKVDFEIKIFGDGIIKTSYTLHNPDKYPICELGIKYILPDTYDSLSWERENYWDYYPKNHLGSAKGNVEIYKNIKSMNYRMKPYNFWENDCWNYYLMNLPKGNILKNLTNIAKASKNKVKYYKLKNKKTNSTVCVYANEDIACRINNKETNNLILYLNNILDYPRINWGNYSANITLNKPYNGSVLLKLE